jgi:putative DNA primase/helicase
MNKDFYNMVGEGDNSKSMMAKLLRLALGKYIGKMPVSTIMGKRSNGDNATPHLADKKGVRALFVEEPPKGQSNVSVVKEFTGGDDILSRALFRMPIVFSPQWKLFVFTNHLLEAPAEEKAYWNRQKVIDHESTFSFDAPLTQEEQFRLKIFPRDPFFDRKLAAMAEPFLWCQIEWYKMFKQEGLKPPQRVVEATNAAKMRNDIYMQYIRNSLDPGTQHDIITLDGMYEDFKSWYTGAGLRVGIPMKLDFEDEMSKIGHLGSRPVGQRWAGVKFKTKTVQLPTFAQSQSVDPNQPVPGIGSGGGPRLITAH